MYYTSGFINKATNFGESFSHCQGHEISAILKQFYITGYYGSLGLLTWGQLTEVDVKLNLEKENFQTFR